MKRKACKENNRVVKKIISVVVVFIAFFCVIGITSFSELGIAELFATEASAWTCKSYSPINNVKYVVIKNGAAVHDGPYGSCTTVCNLKANTIIYVTGKYINNEGHVWYKYSGGYIYEEYVKEHSSCSWHKSGVKTYATCTSTGINIVTCSVCGATGYQTSSALGHNFVNGKCTRCSKWICKSWSIIDSAKYVVTTNGAAVHDGPYGSCTTVCNLKAKTIIYVTAKCINYEGDGHVWYRYSGGFIYEEYVKEHSSCTWDSGKITQSSTCETGGTKTYTCTLCGATKTQSTSALGHNFVNGKCTRCSKWTYKSYSSIDNAKYVVTTNGAAVHDGPYGSCATVGNLNAKTIIYVTGKCINYEGHVWYKYSGGYIYEEYVKEHSSCSWHKSGVKTAATCTSTGINIVTCSVCGATGYQTSPALGHNFVNGKCTRCSAWTYKSYSSIDNVKYVVTTNSAAVHDGPYGSCATVGNLNAKTIIYVTGKYINYEGDGHVWYKYSGGYIYEEYVKKHSSCTWDSGKITQSSTCETGGTKTYTCTLCGATKTQSTSALGHNFVNGKCTRCSKWTYKSYSSINNVKYVVTTNGAAVHDGPYGFCTTVCNLKAKTVIYVTGKYINCADDGNTWYKYSGGYIYGEYVKEHSSCTWNTVKVKSATCTANGTKTYICSLCGATETHEIKKTGHNLVKTGAVAATCTTAGNNVYYTCTVCGKVFADADGKTETTIAAQKISALYHYWNSAVITTDATCTKTGVKTYHCDREGCTAVKTETIPAKGHNIIKVAYKAPTCAATGNNEYYKCSNCGKAFKDAAGKTATTVEAQTIKASSHYWNSGKVTKAATCTTAGIKTYTCDREGCTATKTEKIPATGHSIKKVTAKSATCTTAGNKTYYQCTVCKNAYTDSTAKTATTVAAQTIKAKGHTLKKTAGVAPTCTKKGYWTYYTCSVCNKVFSDAAGTRATTIAGQERDATGHTIKKIAAKAATCTTDGNKAYYKCSNCGKAFKDAAGKTATTVEAQTIKARSHYWNSGKVTKAATCTTAGIKTYTCDREGCTATKTEKIPATGHTIKKVSAKSATCTVAGNKTYYKCSNCGKAFTDSTAKTATTVAAQTIKAKGHTLKKTAGVAPTCTKKGYWTYYTCSLCGKVFSDAAGTRATTIAGQERDATGHTIKKIAAKAATCTTDGNKAYYKCSVCGKAFTDAAGKTATTVAAQTIKARSHYWNSGKVTKAATCTTAGVKTHTCDREGCTATKTEKIPATGHTIKKVAAKSATCTTAGNKTYYQCTVCKKAYTDSAAKTATTVAAQTIKAKGHTLKKVAAKAATCTTDGNKAYYKCSVCGKAFTDAAGKTATTVAAQTIKARSHYWNSGKVTKAATCTTAGVKTYTCDREGCTATKTEKIPATGHTMNKVAACAATKTEDGNKTYYTCSVCGGIFADAAGKTKTTLSAVTIKATGK